MVEVTSALISAGIPLPPHPLPEDERLFVESCLDVFLHVFRLFGFEDSGYSTAGSRRHMLYCAAVCGSGLKYIKWKIAAFYSFHKEQEVAPSVVDTIDNAGCLLGGRAYRFLRLMKREHPDRFDQFVTTILYSKKGMPRPNKKQLRDSTLDTLDSLSQKPFPVASLLPWSDVDTLPRNLATTLSKETFNAQIRRTCTEIFHGKKFELTMGDHLFFPSTSANYNRSRTEGGALGDLSQAIAESYAEMSRELNYNPSENHRELITLNVREIRGRKVLSYNDDRLRVAFNDLYQLALQRAMEQERPLATPLALPESLKVRVITKGPPFLYTVLKPLQKFMWTELQKFSCFKLTGSPVSVDIVQDAVGAKLNPDEAYLSVDYKDATNQLHSWASEAAVDSISDCLSLSDDERFLMHRAMTRHHMDFEESMGSKWVPLSKRLVDQLNRSGANWRKYRTRIRKNVTQIRVPNSFSIRFCQQNGQLMGSIISFVILCIINATIMRWCKELDLGYSIPLAKLQALVNGDDALIKCKKRTKGHWEQIGKFVGLHPSVGKVYYSREFLNINSTTYNYNPVGYESIVRDPFRPIGKSNSRLIHFRRVDYVNLGLLFGLKRSGGTNDLFSIGEYLSVGAQARDLISCSPDWLAEKLLQIFINRNKHRLTGVDPGAPNPTPFQIPWFIPERFGGLGLPIVGRFHPRTKDLRLARKIYDHYRLPILPEISSWYTWKLAMEHFPPEEFASDEFITSNAISMNEFWAKYAIALIFDRSVQLHNLDTSTFQDAAEYYRKLQKLWKKATIDSIPYPEPFSLTNLPPSHNQFDLKIISYENN